MRNGDTHEHTRHSQNVRHERTHITDRMWMCPTCKGSHELGYCKVFKAKSATKRLEVVKRVSLCINCLGRGHSLTQCTSGSCHMCGQRHHTYLHRALTQVSPRYSSDRYSSDRYSSGRSTSGRSSGDRSSGGRSPHNRSLMDDLRLDHRNSTLHIDRDAQPNFRGDLPSRLQKTESLILHMNLEHRGTKAPTEAHRPNTNRRRGRIK